MQCIHFVVAERHRCKRVGATRAPTRAFRPAVAGGPPRRLGLFCPSTASLRSAPQPRRVGLTALLSQVRELVARFRSARQGAVFCRAATVGHARSIAVAVRPMSPMAGLHRLLFSALAACRPPSEYMPSPPMSYFFVLLVSHQANHSFKRTGLRPTA